MAIVKSYTPTADEARAQRQWYIVDAEDKTLGRLSSKIAHILRGKHKPTFAPHLDMGDYVIVINAEKIHTAEGRLDSKLYRHHSKFQGGLKTITLRQQLIKHPERPLEIAIKGMLPKNALGRQMFKKLKIYAGAEHPHTAQNPQPLEV